MRRPSRGLRLAESDEDPFSLDSGTPNLIAANGAALDGGDTLYSLRPDRPLPPASNLKLFTTAAALETTAPEYLRDLKYEFASEGRMPAQVTLTATFDEAYLTPASACQISSDAPFDSGEALARATASYDTWTKLDKGEIGAAQHRTKRQ